jgi:hypothetical protein
VLVIATMTASVVTVHATNGPWGLGHGERNALSGLVGFMAAGIGAGAVTLVALGLDLAGTSGASPPSRSVPSAASVR